MSDTKLALVSRAPLDQLLSPVSLLFVIGDICAEINTISRIIVHLHSKNMLAPKHIEMYRAEFRDLSLLLRQRIIAAIRRFSDYINIIIERREEQHGILIRKCTARLLPSDLKRLTQACRDFRVSEEKLALTWRSRTSQIRDEMKEAHNWASTPGVLWLAVWLLSPLNLLSRSKSVKPPSAEVVTTHLRRLEGLLARLASDVERIEVFWSVRAGALAQHVGPLRVTWNQLEASHWSWERVYVRYKSAGHRISKSVDAVLQLQPQMPSENLGATGFMRQKSSTPYPSH